MKKIIFNIMLLFMIIISFKTAVHASNDDTQYNRKIIIDGNVFYVETVITESALDSPNSVNGTVQTKTATKTEYYRDADMNPICSISVTGTFMYDGTMSQCNSCSHQALTYLSNWSVKNSSSNYFGTSAIANATFTETMLFGISHDYNMSVTISCSSSGVIS